MSHYETNIDIANSFSFDAHMLVSFADGPLPPHVKKAPISGLAPFDAGAGAYPRSRPAFLPPPLSEVRSDMLEW